MLELLNQSVETINIILEQRMPVKLRLALLYNKKQIVTALRTVQQAHREIIQSYVIKEGNEIKTDENGKVLFSNPKDENECLSQLLDLSKLMDTNIDVKVFTQDELEPYLDKLNDVQLESILMMVSID